MSRWLGSFRRVNQSSSDIKQDKMSSNESEEYLDSILSANMESMAYMGDPEVLAQKIHQAQMGHAQPFQSPFGTKQVMYCDYIASGRSLQFIEEYIHKEVLPLYANTHTTTTITAQQTTSFRNESRNIIRNAVNAYSDKDAVIFAGSGCTGAIHKLIHSLYLEKLEEKPLVFNSGQEHHSNLLPWREAGCEVVSMTELPTGHINIEDLERKLSEHRKLSKHRMIIGLFSAASNVSGILNDDLTLTALMHKYGGLAFWDYATAAPYVNIDMNPNVEGDETGLCAKDAVYFSMHKFVGGPQTPGILIAKKELFKSPVPHMGGGGTVLFVTQNDHQYISKIEDREEGGTPAIIESIRAGLVMFAKENIGADFIMSREEKMMQMARDRLQKMPNFIPLGPMEVHKLPILSFLIKCPPILGQGFLHHNFICYVLNDLFGIQARGGCACAGPYVESLLGMTEEGVGHFTGLIQDPYKTASHMNPYVNVAQFERIKPGFARLSLPWFAPEEEIVYILDALEMVAKDGWKLLPQYEYNNETGDWQHHSKIGQMNRKWLNDINLYSQNEASIPVEQIRPWNEIILEAQTTLANARSAAKRVHVEDQRSLFSNASAKLRWFVLPYEGKQALLYPNSINAGRKIQSPFWPKTFQVPKQKHEMVGAYGGHFEITPMLRKILDKKQRKIVPKTTGHGGKLWFQKAFLSNFMEAKTMTGSSSRSALKSASPSTSFEGNNSCCDDDEEENRQYWNKTFLHSKNENLNTYF